MKTIKVLYIVVEEDWIKIDLSAMKSGVSQHAIYLFVWHVQTYFNIYVKCGEGRCSEYTITDTSNTHWHFANIASNLYKL